VTLEIRVILEQVESG